MARLSLTKTFFYLILRIVDKDEQERLLEWLSDMAEQFYHQINLKNGKKKTKKNLL
jgi:hypothetical protein